jgi:hypothetical protein
MVHACRVITAHRRCARDHQRVPEGHEAMVLWAMVLWAMVAG